MEALHLYILLGASQVSFVQTKKFEQKTYFENEKETEGKITNIKG